MRLCNLVAERCSDNSVNVCDGHVNDGLCGPTVRNRSERAADDFVVDARGGVECVVLLGDAVGGGALPQGECGREDGRQIQIAQFFRASLHVGPEEIAAANHFVECAESEARHVLSDLLCDHKEVVDHVLRLPLKLLPQLGVLRCDSDGARVQMALAHHCAPERNERRRRKPKLLRPEQRRQHDVASRAQLAVRLQHNAPAEIVQHERLVRLCQAKLPRQPRMLDARPAAGAGPAVVARDQNVLRVALSNARSNDAHAGFRHELHRYARRWIGALEVENQLGEILDRVDVVVRRRRNEANTSRRVAGLCNAVADLVSGELTALAGLGTLGHLDLQFVRI
eukprot:Opistho-2@20015